MKDELDAPDISIAMPVFNAASTIEAAINSILLQTYTRWELIIIDDGSTDQGIDLVKSYNDPRIIVLRDGVNKGISYRLNQAINLAHGVYFARMDADDIAFPERLARQIDHMNNNPMIDLLATGAVVFDNRGETKGCIEVNTNHNEICCRPWNGFYMPHPTWLGRTEWFRRNRYRTVADKAEDQDLLFRAYLTSKYECIPEILLGYRQNRRSLAKMISARRAFLRSFAETALQRGQLISFFLVFSTITLKIFADILNIAFNITPLRNKLAATPKEVEHQWQRVWQNVHDGPVA